MSSNLHKSQIGRTVIAIPRVERLILFGLLFANT